MGGTMTGRSPGPLPGLDPAEQQAWESFLGAALRVYGSLNRVLSEEHSLNLADVRLLEILCSSESGAARMGDLAMQLVSLPSRVTRQIRRLEQAGLVRRQASPDDGRGVLAAVTDEGRDVLALAIVTYAQAVRQRFVRPLTRSQMSSLGENCERISAALKSSSPDGKVKASSPDGKASRR
jgi:DNA-binding MarR family transcriptional regulator